MDEMKKKVRRIFWLHTVLFAAVILYLLKFMAFDSKGVITNSYNPRLSLMDGSVARGSIFGRGGEALAEGGAEARAYPFGEAFAHVVGYIGQGRAGVESKYNFELQKLDAELWQRVKAVLDGGRPMADSAALTLDAELQRRSAELLKGKKGAVVALEPSTGKVLAMTSAPAFDPNSLSDEWETLRADGDNSPLLNRAAQGVYPPGSIFKLVTAVAAVRHMEDYGSFTYECGGEALFDGKLLRCYNNTSHGHVDLKTAFAKSCNLFFAEAALAVGADALRETARELMFGAPVSFALPSGGSAFPLDGSAGVSELVETAIGQGRTTVTPLHMALLTAAVANGGVMMEPYLLDHTVSYSGKEKHKVMPGLLAQPFTTDESRLLAELMGEAVANGTGRAAAVEGIAVAGKTGTAENAAGSDHGWFVGFAPAENPRIAIAVLLENSGGSGSALPVAKALFETYLRGS